jgi:hypothetical protein
LNSTSTRLPPARVRCARHLFSKISFIKKKKKEFILFAQVEQDLDTLAAGACPLRKAFLFYFNHLFPLRAG